MQKIRFPQLNDLVLPFPLSFCFCCSLQSTWNQVVDSFDEMSLKEALLRGIYAYGFEKPSAIQQRAIVPCIKGRLDVFSFTLLQFSVKSFVCGESLQIIFTLFGAAYSALPCTNVGYMLDMSPALLISLALLPLYLQPFYSFQHVIKHFLNA